MGGSTSWRARRSDLSRVALGLAPQRLVAPAYLRAAQGESEETAVTHRRHLALGRIDLEFEAGLQVTREIVHHALPGPLAFDQNDPIVRVAGKAMAPPFQFLVELVQQNVCQKWRKRTALGRADLAGLDVLSDQHPRAQVASDQGQQPLVADGLPQPVHKPVMIDRIEKLGQVQATAMR